MRGKGKGMLGGAEKTSIFSSFTSLSKRKEEWTAGDKKRKK